MKNITKQISSRKVMEKHSEEGFVLVVSLVLLVILALFGMFATRMATTEYQIAGNERTYVENFYHTESQLMDFAKEIDNETETNLQNQKIDGYNAEVMVLKSEISGYDSSSKKNIDGYLTNKGDTKDGVRVLAVDVGDGGGFGESLKMTTLKLHRIDVLSQSKANGTNKIIKIGLKKQY